VLAIRERRLGHQSPQAGLVGLVGEVRQLLVGDGELATELDESPGQLRQPPFDQRAGHGAGVYGE
jgi:hypothetical protein